MSEVPRDHPRGKPDSATNRHEPNKNDRKPNNPTYGERKGGFGKGGENVTDPQARARGDRHEANRAREEKMAELAREKENYFNERKEEISSINEKNRAAITYEKIAGSRKQISSTVSIPTKIHKHNKIPADLMELLNTRPPKRKEHILDGCVIKPE